MDGEPSWSWDHAASPEHRHFVFWLVLKGSGVLQAGERRYELSAGDCLLSPLREAHTGRHGQRARLSVIWAVYDYVDSRGRSLMPSVDPLRRRTIEDAPLMEVMFRRLVDAHTKQHDFWQSAQWLQAVLVEVARQDAKPKLHGLEREQYRRIERVCSAVQADPAQRWRIEDMAALSDYATSHFLRLFRRFVGVTPNDFVIATRIGEARRLLRSTGMSIHDISEKLGYTDAFYFTKQFTKRVGMSPRLYRKR